MARKEKQYHYIYKTVCNISGRYYIGMHSTNNLDDGYLGSGKRLWNSIKYYGKENHSIEILEYCDNRENLRKREAEIVNEDSIKDVMCMNLKHGGDGGLSGLSDVIIKKISKAGNDKLKELRTNDKEWVKKDSERRSKLLKEEYKNGKRTIKKFNYNSTGFKHDEETKKNISTIMSEKQKGKKNSQYGTKWAWINKDNEVKKIKKDELSDYVKNGWNKGIKKSEKSMN